MTSIMFWALWILGPLNFMINVRKWVSLTGPLVSKSPSHDKLRLVTLYSNHFLINTCSRSGKVCGQLISTRGFATMTTLYEHAFSVTFKSQSIPTAPCYSTWRCKLHQKHQALQRYSHSSIKLSSTGFGRG